MRARLKLLCLLACSLFALSAYGNSLGVSCYTGTTAQSPIKQGCKSVVFTIIGFTGTIGNASFSNQTASITLGSGQDGDRLNDIPYTVSSGTLIICEVK